MARFAWVRVVGLALLLGLPVPAAADDCKLQYFPVPLVPNQRGAVLVPVKIGDKTAIFQLATADTFGIIRRSKVGDFPTRHQPIKMHFLGDQTSNEVANLHNFVIGPYELKRVEMFVVPDGDRKADDPIWGAIGSDILQQFDVELNLAENKLNFFVPSDCGINAVYWQNDAIAELPFERNGADHISFTVKLDGKPVTAVLDTGSFASLLSLNAARWLYDLEPGKPGLEDAGKVIDANGQSLPLYRHRFESLEIEGLRFNQPWITITKGNFGDSTSWPTTKYQLSLGVHQLRGLHLLISYHDKKVYVTKASIGADSFAEDVAPAAAPRAPVPLMDSLDWQVLQPYAERFNSALREGKFDVALAAIDDLVAHYPNYAIIYYDRARINLKRQDNDAALADLDHAISLFPSYADAYRLRAAVRRYKHDDDGAKADLDAAVKFEPNSATTYEMRAEQRRRDEDDDGALADANRAIELDPKLAVAYVTRGEVFYHRKDYEHALAEVQQASALDPKNTLAIEVAGHAFHRLGRQDEALASYGQAVELAPKVGRDRNFRCWQLAMMGRFQEALEDCDRGVELSPKWYPVADNRGYVYLKLHRLKDAIADFDAALAIKPDAAHSMYGRSLAKQELGDAKGSAADLAAAQQIQPDIAQHFPE